MNTDIIREAAEDFRKDNTYVQGIGTIERLQEIQDKEYARRITHFLSFAKQRGLELVDVKEEDWQTVFKSMWDNNQFDDKFTRNLTAAYFFHKGFNKALAIGASRERERMMKFAEWAYINNWSYCGNDVWVKGFDWNMERKTTSELLEIFNQENKEG